MCALKIAVKKFLVSDTGATPGFRVTEKYLINVSGSCRLTDAERCYGAGMNINAAYNFYRSFILDADKARVLAEHGFSINGTVAPAVWECLGAVLYAKRKQAGYGADLGDVEVKSVAAASSGVEYQYHKESGLAKLRHDMTIDHLYLFYGNEYKSLDAFLVRGESLTPMMREWESRLVGWYDNASHQRFRCSVKSKFVKANGKRVMVIENGKLLT